MNNLTTQQVMHLAEVSHMTVYTWRQGTATKDALPSVPGSRPRSVEFDPHVLKIWASNNGVPLKANPVAVARGKVVLTPPAFTPTKTVATKPDTKASKSQAKQGSDPGKRLAQQKVKN